MAVMLVVFVVVEGFGVIFKVIMIVVVLVFMTIMSVAVGLGLCLK